MGEPDSSPTEGAVSHLKCYASVEQANCIWLFTSFINTLDAISKATRHLSHRNRQELGSAAFLVNVTR